jgi:hypothetical protein
MVVQTVKPIMNEQQHSAPMKKKCPWVSAIFQQNVSGIVMQGRGEGTVLVPVVLPCIGRDCKFWGERDCMYVELAEKVRIAAEKFEKMADK